MKIDKIELLYVKPRWLFLKIYTDNGIVGYGEPSLEGNSAAVKAVIDSWKEYLIGQDPMNLQHIWHVLHKNTFYRNGAVICTALSGLDQALWDIKGKYLGVPVYQLLGGKNRDKIRMYTHIKKAAIKGGNTVEEMIDLAKKRVSEGYTALKYSIIPPIEYMETKNNLDTHISRFARIREEIGYSVDLAIDFHGRVSPTLSPILIKELTPFYPFFIEEPCLPENVKSYEKIYNSTTTPIAAGERFFTKWGYRDIVEKGYIDILQPDISHVGGILEGIKIAALAETYYKAVSPHNPLGPVSLASCLQFDAAIPNFMIQEHPYIEDKSDLGFGLLKNPFIVKDGYVDVSDKPGLGIELDEDLLKDRLYNGDWNTPSVYYNDGSVADW